jgi:hypothetical protein
VIAKNMRTCNNDILGRGGGGGWFEHRHTPLPAAPPLVCRIFPILRQTRTHKTICPRPRSITTGAEHTSRPSFKIS